MNVQEQKSRRRTRRQAATAAEAEARAADHLVKVAMAAYFIAEKRGFEPGHEVEDWLAAEAEIDEVEPASVLKSIQSSPAQSAS
jgi:hypothetical protein